MSKQKEMFHQDLLGRNDGANQQEILFVQLFPRDQPRCPPYDTLPTLLCTGNCSSVSSSPWSSKLSSL